MGCCASNKKTATAAVSSDATEVRDKVRTGYAKVAQAGRLAAAAENSAGGCCGGTPVSADQLAQQIGYSESELHLLPEGANMGLSCGNPTAIANLKPGQTVLDLGSGGGFDVFLAGPKVGANGHVIGVDMTYEMIAKARHNQKSYRARTGLDNVEFRLGEIEHLPVADATVDVVISNCVINLSPDKLQVWREIARVLKPGGIVTVSDMALLQQLPPQVAGRVEALVGCIAGAVLVEEYRAMIERAGLRDIRLTPKPQYVEALVNSKDPLYHGLVELLPAGRNAADYITSLDVMARKI